MTNLKFCEKLFDAIEGGEWEEKLVACEYFTLKTLQLLEKGTEKELDDYSRLFGTFAIKSTTTYKHNLLALAEMLRNKAFYNDKKNIKEIKAFLTQLRMIILKR